MSSYTLEQLRSLVEQRTGVSIGTNTRASSATVDIWLNQAIGKYELELNRGQPSQSTTRTTLTTSASTTETAGWPANEFVAFPSDFLALISMTIYDGTRRISMREFSEHDRDVFEQDVGGTYSPGLPCEFRVATNTSGLRGARLLPPANDAYTIELLYIQTVTALSGDTETYSFVTGTEDAVVCDAAIALLQGDGVPEPEQYKEIKYCRDRALMILRDYASQVNRTGSSGMVNTRRMRRRNRLLAAPFWRGIA